MYIYKWHDPVPLPSGNPRGSERRHSRLSRRLRIPNKAAVLRKPDLQCNSRRYRQCLRVLLCRRSRRGHRWKHLHRRHSWRHDIHHTTPCPVTAGAYQSAIISPGDTAPFVAKVSPDASTLLYSTLVATGLTSGMALTTDRQVSWSEQHPITTPSPPMHTVR
jgi:hypothetical protein